MNHMKNRYRKTQAASALWAVAGALLVMSAQSNADTTLKVTSSIKAGSCEVRLLRGADATGSAGSGSTELDVEIGTVAPELLVEGGVTAFRKDSAVTLKLQCAGVVSGGGAGVTPTIMVSGTPVGGSTAGAYLFKGNATSTIDPRVGAVLSTEEGDSPTIQSWDTTHYLKSGDELALTAVGDGNNAQDMSVTLYSGMSCGDATSCDKAGQGALQTGQLYAPVTFDFAYK